MTVYNPSTAGAGYNPVSTSGNFKVEQYRKSIRMIESGSFAGNYQAKGPVITNKNSRYFGDRAVGAYQVMSRNIPQWSKEALGRQLTTEEFLANPKLQDAIFDFQFNKSIVKYGSASDAASVWFTGRPASNKKAQNSSDGHTTGNQYVTRFNKNMAILSGGHAPTSPVKAPDVKSDAPAAKRAQRPVAPPLEDTRHEGLFRNFGSNGDLKRAVDDQHEGIQLFR